MYPHNSSLLQTFIIPCPIATYSTMAYPVVQVLGALLHLVCPQQVAAAAPKLGCTQNHHNHCCCCKSCSSSARCKTSCHPCPPLEILTLSADAERPKCTCQFQYDGCSTAVAAPLLRNHQNPLRRVTSQGMASMPISPTRPRPSGAA
jgi:hypothetical protein